MEVQDQVMIHSSRNLKAAVFRMTSSGTLTTSGWRGYTSASVAMSWPNLRMRTNIQRFACSLGAMQKYHETITIFWMRLVKIAGHLSPRMDRFDDFARAHAWLFDKERAFEFYSRELLMSDTARKVWVEPDQSNPIPFNAQPTRVEATFYIEEFGDKNRPQHQLQYSQTVWLNFGGSLWPQVSVANLQRQP
jgi:hypothetical protein